MSLPQGDKKLRKLGIIGGMTWSSTALYYDHINREISRRLGGLHSGRIDPPAVKSPEPPGDLAVDVVVIKCRRRPGHASNDAKLAQFFVPLWQRHFRQVEECDKR